MNHELSDSTLIDGRYRLDVKLGSGAFGSVYKAGQLVMDRPLRDVALKLFHGEAIRADNVQQMMNDALQIQAVLDRLTDWEVRQHFVTVYDLGVTRDTPPRGYVAMELVRGGSLDGRIHDGRKFTLHGALHYLLQIARALAYMHSEQFVHSDLKPANVLVFRGRDSDLVKIGDFGLAGKYVGPYSNGPRGGTMSYMAPEALSGWATTPGCDVFSLGVMAYEMLTGGNPYDHVGRTLDPEAPDHNAQMNELQRMSREVPRQLRREDYPELAGLGPDGAPLAALLDVINRMLQTDLSLRYPSARGVYRDLQRIADGRLPSLTDDEPAADAPPPPAPPPAGDPLAAVADQCQYHLAREDWAAAAQTAGELVRRAPHRALGHRLKAQISLHQAQRESTAEAAGQLRRQAIRILERGVDQCPGADERRTLRQTIADIYRELGDYETARYIQNLRT